MIKRGPLLNALDEIEARCTKGDLTLRDIFDMMGPAGHNILNLFFILPFLQPIPLPGLSSILGILIAAAAYFSYIGRAPWLPQVWSKKKLSSKTVFKVAEAVEKIFEKLSFLFHPRWPVLFQEPFRFISMLITVVSALLLSLPLPIPFSNAIPAWVILLQTFANLERDGLFVLFSYLQAIVCFFYFYLLVTGAKTGIEWLGF